MIDLDNILDRIPHRPPFLMVDAVDWVLPGNCISVFKTVQATEPYFEGHFVGNPVMPGVLIVEALMQAGSVLASYTPGAVPSNQVPLVVNIERARFRAPVLPGAVLRLEVVLVLQRLNIWQFTGRAYVKDTVVAEASWTGLVAALKGTPDVG